MESYHVSATQSSRYLSATYAAEVVRSKDKISSLSPSIHHQFTIDEQTKDIREIEHNIAICFLSGRLSDVSLDILNFLNAAFGVAFVNAT